MHACYIGPFAQSTKDGKLAHAAMRHIHWAGFSLEIVPITSCDTENLDEEYHELLPLLRPSSSEHVTHRIFHADPETAVQIVREEQTKGPAEMIVVSRDAMAEQALAVWARELPLFHFIALTSAHGSGYWDRWPMPGFRLLAWACNVAFVVVPS